MTKARNYPKEYAAYYGPPGSGGNTAAQRRHREEKASRRKARAKMAAEGRCSLHADGYEVDHKDGNPLHNGRKNLQVVTRHKNRVKG